MARSIRSRAPAPPGAADGGGAMAEAPLGGTRAEAMRRLQMGAVGVVAVLLLIGLASIIKDRASQTENNSVAEAAATAAPGASTAAADPLAEAGVVPDIPAGPSAGVASPSTQPSSPTPAPSAVTADPQGAR